MKQSPVVRLSVMMFFQYAIWGIWLPIAGKFLGADPAEGGLGFDGYEIGLILGVAGSVGALVSPFLAGQLADRTFRAERVLAGLLLVGGAVKWYTATRTGYQAWLWLSIGYSVLFMPTLALSNSIAFAHLEDGDREFPFVRMWGTIGWIAASWVFPWIWLQHDLALAWKPPFLAGPEHADVVHRMIDSMKFAAGISWVYALYCLTLPATPPKRDALQPLAFTKAFGLVRHRSFAVLVGVGLLISILHQIYFIQAPNFLPAAGLRTADIGPAMTVGQFSEILVIGLLGLFLKRLGYRLVLFVGALCYFLRYVVWSLDLPVELLVGSLVLHGFCYACFFAAAYIYVDRIAPVDVRHSAQNVFAIIMIGGGPAIGGVLNGPLQEHFTAGGVVDYGGLWRTLAAAGLVAALAVLLLFRDETGAERVGRA